MAETQTLTNTDVMYCTVHPTVETTLRCNRCGRPMCIKCSRRTPVGYRCKECVRGQQQTFYTAKGLDPVIQGVVSVVLSAIAGFLIGLIGASFGFFMIFIMLAVGSGAGGLIADLAHRAAGRRRSRYSWLIVAGGVVVGALIALPVVLFTAGNLLGWGIYLVTATTAAVGRLRLGRR